jgi:hypothetical protein
MNRKAIAMLLGALALGTALPAQQAASSANAAAAAAAPAPANAVATASAKTRGFVVRPLDEKRLVVTLVAAGTSREDAIDNARRRAVLGSAGRALLDGYLIYADELLSKYLVNYAPRFVDGVEVVSSEVIGGETVLDVRVIVGWARLLADLKDKRFLYEPSYKPPFAPFFEESRDGIPSDEGVARTAIIQAFLAAGVKPFEGILVGVTQTVDVASDEFLLRNALIQAQRNGIEIIVTGTAATKQREQRDIYFDSFVFYDCEMTAALVRVDTGEILYRTETTGSAAARDRSEAIRLSIERAAEQVATEFSADLLPWWPVVVRGQGTYEVLLTGASDELRGIVEQYLGELGTDTKVHLRKAFEGCAHLVIETSSSREDLLEKLAACPYPTLTNLTPDAARKFEFQVGG